MVENQRDRYIQCNVPCGKWADLAFDRFSALRGEIGRTLVCSAEYWMRIKPMLGVYMMRRVSLRLCLNQLLLKVRKYCSLRASLHDRWARESLYGSARALAPEVPLRGFSVCLRKRRISYGMIIPFRDLRRSNDQQAHILCSRWLPHHICRWDNPLTELLPISRSMRVSMPSLAPPKPMKDTKRRRRGEIHYRNRVRRFFQDTFKQSSRW